MHETGMIRDLVHRLEAAAREAGTKSIAGADVWIGALSQMSADHFREHFNEAARGTLAEGAALKLEVSDDLDDPKALSVVLQSVELKV